MNLQAIIGLETHVQLKTASKMFCGCSNHSEGVAPNVNVCPVCLGHPGVLPVPNEQAIRSAILLGLALDGKIAKHSKFDRKNYFYPDLPKSYQISQFDLPIMSEGSLTFEVPGEEKTITIGIERLHLEEDAAKNIHGDDGKTYVDFNRGGTPLVEIVTHPHFTSAAQAKAYLQEIRLIVRTLGISYGDMEKGQLRADVNISMREVDENGEPLSKSLNPKTEIKNVNSFKAVERAIEYEIQRQTKLWEADDIPRLTTTRGWSDAKQVTELQRTKEGFADYRYFPEPDIPPMDLADLADEISHKIPELPKAKRDRFITEYGIKPSEAKQIIDDPALADFTEQALSELEAWLQAEPDVDSEQATIQRQKLTKLFVSWLLNKLLGVVAERKIGLKIMKITPENFAEFIKLIAEGKLTGQSGLQVLGRMLDDGSDPSDVMDELGASRLDDVSALIKVIDAVIEESSDEVARYKAGDTKLLQWFMGQVMKETHGKADPDTTVRLIGERLQ
ncbi:MAG: Asp-tRNA(Asn)/Glu-tRNA(Gln) amidotransferase subunit GatB [Candidatus Uhrbacteria bacterium]|nr:Asp-tRNA(Asn)/Glu-tRNA(Gln) amidotransferase subunit GatB [Candidatus Uhrbacteria bacterium]